ncbi:MAG: hypothetical protein HUJ30_04160 [Gammaproteobacteria bacterium]|nr:hypothetical protein [Gammaproteobacteria bacterium]
MFNSKKFIRLTILTGMALTLSACASFPNTQNLDESQIKLQVIDSNFVKIHHVSVSNSGTGMFLTGKVERRFKLRGLIPGHIDVELFDINGKVKYSGVINYMRKNRHSYYAKFSKELSFPIERGSSLKLKYHRGDHHSHHS